MKCVSITLNGKITKVGNDFFVSHNIFDAYSQIPTKLPIINLTNTSEYTLNQKVNFQIVLEGNNEYYALLLKK